MKHRWKPVSVHTHRCLQCGCIKREGDWNDRLGYREIVYKLIADEDFCHKRAPKCEPRPVLEFGQTARVIF